METNTQTVTTYTFTPEELSKVITAAIIIYDKGMNNKTATEEHKKILYEDTLESIVKEDLHGEFLKEYDQLIELLPSIPGYVKPNE